MKSEYIGAFRRVLVSNAMCSVLCSCHYACPNGQQRFTEILLRSPQKNYEHRNRFVLHCKSDSPQ